MCANKFWNGNWDLSLFLWGGHRWEASQLKCDDDFPIAMLRRITGHRFINHYYVGDQKWKVAERSIGEVVY